MVSAREAVLPSGIDAMQQLGAAELGMLLVGVALLGLTVFGALRAARYAREFDARVVAEIAECFVQLARLRGLELVPAPAYHHSVIGDVPMAPTLTGALQGVHVSLALESEPSGDEALEMTLRARPLAGAVWPTVRRPCSDTKTLSAAAQGAVAALCEHSKRVEIGPGGLVAVPRMTLPPGWITREYRCELDPARLDEWVGLALKAALEIDATARS